MIVIFANAVESAIVESHFAGVLDESVDFDVISG
jgi:hypothetical protein